MCDVIEQVMQWRIQDFLERGANLMVGDQLLMRPFFVKFVCQNKRIGTLGGRRPDAPPLEPPM